MAAVTILADAAALAEAAAKRVTLLIERAVAERGNAFVSMTGGRTPRSLYELLADHARPWRRRIPWTKVHLLWGDERHVPPDHPDSNFGMAEKSLLRHVPVPPSQIYRIPAELPDAGAAARIYDGELRRAFAAARRPAVACDLMLLGIGEDAHIASIFPGSTLLEPGEGLVAAVWVPHLHTSRITLTPPAIIGAHAILVIASGAAKAHAIHAAIEKPWNVKRWPAQLLRQADERVSWMVDEEAAALLSRGAPPA
jgi:6-phosphogluconolactonase